MAKKQPDFLKPKPSEIHLVCSFQGTFGIRYNPNKVVVTAREGRVTFTAKEHSVRFVVI